MSKQPLVKPTRSPCLRHSAEMRVEHVGRRDLLFGRERGMRQDLSPQFGLRHRRGALLADGNRRRRIRHPQRSFPVGAGRERQRERRRDRIARAGDVAHLHRQRRHVDGLARARHQRHAVLALRHQHGLAIGENHRIARGLRDARIAVGAAAGRLGKFLAIWRQQGRAAIDREIGALGIDDHALAEFLRGIDHVADHPRRQDALGVIRQQHDVGARDVRQHRVDQLLLDLAGSRLRQLPVGAQHVGGKMLGDEAHLARGRPRRVVHQHAFNARLLLQRHREPDADLVLADQAGEDAASAERSDVARDIAGAADIGLAALRRDDRRRRLRRNPRHLAIDELVEHEVADAEHRLPAEGLREGVEIEHRYSSSPAPISGSDRRDRETLSRKDRRHLPAR